MARSAEWYYDKLKVTGMRDIRKELRKVDIPGKAIKPAYSEVSEFAADVARGAAPHGRTGKLSGSIKPRPTSTMARIEMGGGVKYTFLNEFGGGAKWRSRRGMSRRGPFPFGGYRTRATMYIFHKPHKADGGFGGYHVLPAIRDKADNVAELFIKAVDKLLKGML